MNIFFLDKDAKLAAKMHCDKHVVKMILESAQLLSTAHRVLDGKQWIDSSSGRKIKRWKLDDDFRESALYKATHINHPSAVWVRESKQHYDYLFDLFFHLCREYTYRYGKIHKCDSMFSALLQYPKNLADNGFTEPPQAMPEYCRIPGDSVQAYRNYYIKEKTSMLKYTKREAPMWINIQKGN